MSDDTLPVGSKNKSKSARRRRPPNLIFSKNFKKLLEEKNMTIRRAAKIAETSMSTVFGWVNGVHPTDPEAILKLCEALGADFQYLLTGKPSHKISPNRLSEMFEVEQISSLEGIYLIDAKKLRWRK